MAVPNQPRPCSTCQHGAVFLGIPFCEEGSFVPDPDEFLPPDVVHSPAVEEWLSGRRETPCPVYTPRDDKNGGTA